MDIIKNKWLEIGVENVGAEVVSIKGIRTGSN